MQRLIETFTSLIRKHMQPWVIGTVPIKLTTPELLAFAGQFFQTSVEIVNGETTEYLSLGYSDINIIMESLGFERKVAHCAFEGLSVSWVVTLKQNSSYEFK